MTEIHNKDSKQFYIYRFLNSDKEIIYLGRTVNIEKRLKQHFKTGGDLPRECLVETDIIEYSKFPLIMDIHILEKYLICYYKPKYNIKDKGETSLYIDTTNFKWEKINEKSMQQLIVELRSYENGITINGTWEVLCTGMNELMRIQGITYNELANKSNMSVNTIYGIINGTVKNPNIGTIDKIARGFGLSLRGFFKKLDM